MSARMPGLWLLASLLVLGLSRLLSIAPETAGGGVLGPFSDQALPTVCLLHRWTGIPCPSCGLTRAFIALAHGDWQSAWHFHSLGWAVFALVLLNVPLRLRDLWRQYERKPLASVRWELASWAAVGVALIVRWLGLFLLGAGGVE